MSSNPRQPDAPLLWSEPGHERTALVAEVALAMPIFKLYSFAVPAELEASLEVGHRVEVAVGPAGRRATGFVTRLMRQPLTTTLRPLTRLVDTHTALTTELVELGRRIAEHYAVPLGLTLKAMAPEAARLGRGLRTVRYVRLLRSPSAPQTTEYPPLRPRSAGVLKVLEDHAGVLPVAQLKVEAGCSDAMIRKLAANGWVEVYIRREAVEQPIASAMACTEDHMLNPDQQTALTTIAGDMERGGFRAILLYGVSGSGKTEVYIHAIRRALAAGRQAILLVPEIVLATQIVTRLASRFERVAVMHSAMTESERAKSWRAAASGAVDVVIGTRSAVFAPLANLGLICVDEEQESSYKNLQVPRFHVREAALFRAQRLGIPVILGSATPSLETWRHAATRLDYDRVYLPKRVGDRPLPVIHVVDMNIEAQAAGASAVLSRFLKRKLTETFERREQAIILLNRRGYATRVWCPACRTSVQCPKCSVSLVVHESRGQAVCHHCMSRIEIPRICPTVTCRQALVQRGVGTQRAEAVLRSMFPERMFQRVDSDTMHHRDEYVRVVRDFEERRIDALIGTQMIAKGLDFPHVSLVGVLAAEAMSLSPDFRNQERLFQLIAQVAGRAGRADTPGEVVIQTTLPDVPGLRFARRHDYEGFAVEELRQREVLGYPPYRRLGRVVVAHARDETAAQVAHRWATFLRERITQDRTPGADVFGPAPCQRTRLRERYRHEVLLRTAEPSDLQTLLIAAQQELTRSTGATVTIDVDPVEFD